MRQRMPNIRCIIKRTSSTINFSDIKQDLCLATNLRIKGKRNLMLGVYFNTSVASICNNLDSNTSIDVTRNWFFEISQTNKKSTLAVFSHYLSKKSILIGEYKAAIDIPNDTYVDNMKDTSLLDGGDNSLFCTTQAHDFL